MSTENFNKYLVSVEFKEGRSATVDNVKAGIHGNRQRGFLEIVHCGINNLWIV